MVNSILVIDLGLTNCKTVFFDFNGAELERESLPYPTYYPKNGWAEQDPWDWWQAVICGLQAVAARSPQFLTSVQAISVTGHMHSLVSVDAEGELVGPCLILGDQRAVAEAEWLTAQVGLERIYHITGARMDASMPLAKILWLKRSEPELYRKVDLFLSSKDWLRSQLTGSHGCSGNRGCPGDRLTDPIDACGTSLYDLSLAEWSPELMELAGIRLEQLPVIADPCAIAGQLSSWAAEQMGLVPGIPVIVGSGDDVEVLGHGLVRPGIALEHLGTTGSILTCSDRLAYDPNMAVEIYPHVLAVGSASVVPVGNQGRWVLGGSVTAAGMALGWARQVLNNQELDEQGPAGAQMRPFPAAPLVFVPHLAGERCPNWDARVRGAWCGLNATHTAADLYHAVLEGVAFSLKNVLERIEVLAGKQEAVTISRRELLNPAWANLRAAIYNRPLTVLDTDEPTALGAMVLAAVGIGIYPAFEDAIQKANFSCSQILPDEDHVRYYEQIYPLYLEAAEAQRNLMESWRGRLERGR